MPFITSQQEVTHIRERLIQRVRFIHLFLGVWAEPAHPYLRPQRLCFSSSAKPGTIVGKHLPFTYTGKPHHAS